MNNNFSVVHERFADINKRIDDTNNSINDRIDDTNKRIDDLRDSTSNAVCDLKGQVDRVEMQNKKIIHYLVKLKKSVDQVLANKS